MGAKHLSPAVLVLALAALALSGCAVHLTDPEPAPAATATQHAQEPSGSVSSVPGQTSPSTSATATSPAPDPSATDLPLAQVATQPSQGVPDSSPVWGRMSQVVVYPVAQMPPGGYMLQGSMRQAMQCRATAYADEARKDQTYVGSTNAGFSVPDGTRVVVLDRCEARTSSRKVMGKAPKEPKPISVSTGVVAP